MANLDLRTKSRRERNKFCSGSGVKARFINYFNCCFKQAYSVLLRYFSMSDLNVMDMIPKIFT